MQISNIGKYFARISHVFVYIVKVIEHDLPPAIEVVQCFLGACTNTVRPMQFCHEFYFIGHC